MVTPFFSQTKTWKIGYPLFVTAFSNSFWALNLKSYCLLCRYHCKNTFYYHHLSMVCTINVQRGCTTCCHRQVFEKIYANLTLKVPISCRYHSKNTLYYHLSMVCMINVQRKCIACYCMQVFEKVYANLSLKVPISVLFYLLNLTWKVWFPPFFLKIFLPHLVFPILNFFSVPPFL